MKILGLDLSSSTGYAVIEGGNLKTYGLIKNDDVGLVGSLPEYHFIQKARAIANRLFVVCKEHKPDLVIIEQTNLGNARDTQKGLEFVHYAVLDMLEVIGLIDKTSYVDSSAWRGVVGLKLSKEQRKHNSNLSKKSKEAKSKGTKIVSKKGEGKITWKHLSVDWANRMFGLSFKLVNNDIADAIGLAVYGHLKDTEIKKLTKSDDDFDIKIFDS